MGCYKPGGRPQRCSERWQRIPHCLGAGRGRDLAWDRAVIFSSAVLILSLALTAVAETSGRGGLLQQADAARAPVVALVIRVMRGRLVSAAVGALLDRAPAAVGERLSPAAATAAGGATSRRCACGSRARVCSPKWSSSSHGRPT
jgi:hypothetical protein